MAWQNGVYIKKAIESSMHKESKYPNKPFLESKLEKVVVDEQEEIKRKFMERMDILNSRFGKEGTDG